jgi:tRNA-Thr(GGU) m(6)t(6)A37 methyltransferase TsaA
MQSGYRVVAIGHVERSNDQTEPGQFFDPSVVSEIVIDPEWEPALAGLEDYSHLHVLFWLDRAERPSEPPPPRPAEGRETLPPVGLFATRTPRRPNPIGLAVVRLVRRDGNRLRVIGLDAWDGTPVLDLKGYTRRDDIREDVTHPEWLERLWKLHDQER